MEIKTFHGNPSGFDRWRVHTRMVLYSKGLQPVLSCREKADGNPELNTIAFAYLSQAAYGHNAYHLVQRYEATEDGHGAWANLNDWYEDKSDKEFGLKKQLSNIYFTDGDETYKYIGKFLGTYYRLSRISEDPEKLHNDAKLTFVSNIEHPRYVPFKVDLLNLIRKDGIEANDLECFATRLNEFSRILSNLS